MSVSGRCHTVRRLVSPVWSWRAPGAASDLAAPPVPDPVVAAPVTPPLRLPPLPPPPPPAFRAAAFLFRRADFEVFGAQAPCSPMRDLRIPSELKCMK